MLRVRWLPRQVVRTDGGAYERAHEHAHERADFAAAQIQMRANADNQQAGDPKNIYDNVVFNIACVAVGVASAAVGLFLVAVDAGKSAGIDCLSLPSRASSAPEEKEADELEPTSPASL